MMKRDIGDCVVRAGGFELTCVVELIIPVDASISQLMLFGVDY